MKYLLILFTIFASISGFAQDFKGVWLGYMDTDLQHIRTLSVNYILHVKEQDNNIVNGKAYLYRDNPLRAEGILDFIGVINKGSLRINELKILHSKIPSDTARFLCIKDLKLNLSKEDGIDNLTGTFTGAGENSLPCYPGNVYLQRFTDANKQNIPQNYLTSILLDARDPNVFLQTKLAADSSGYVEISLHEENAATAYFDDLAIRILEKQIRARCRIRALQTHRL